MRNSVQAMSEGAAVGDLCDVRGRRQGCGKRGEGALHLQATRFPGSVIGQEENYIVTIYSLRYVGGQQTEGHPERLEL